MLGGFVIPNLLILLALLALVIVGVVFLVKRVRKRKSKQEVIPPFDESS